MAPLQRVHEVESKGLAALNLGRSRRVSSNFARAACGRTACALAKWRPEPCGDQAQCADQEEGRNPKLKFAGAAYRGINDQPAAQRKERHDAERAKYFAKRLHVPVLPTCFAHRPATPTFGNAPAGAR